MMDVTKELEFSWEENIAIQAVFVKHKFPRYGHYFRKL